jgi:zinc protease
MIYAPQNVTKLGQAFREEIERAAREGFGADELEAAKAGWLKSRQVSRSTDSGLAGLLNSYLFYNRDLTFDAEREQRVRSLTPEQVNATIKKHLNYSRMILVKAGDFAKGTATQ